MKILFLSTRIPYPLTAGFRIRIYNEAKYLKKAGHQISLMYIGNLEDYQRYKQELKIVFDKIYLIQLNKIEAIFNLCKTVFNPVKPFQVALYESSRFYKHLKELAGEYDVIIGNTIRTAEYLRRIGADKAILDLHDAISYNYKNAIKNMKGLQKLIYKIEYYRVLHYEKDSIRTFRKVVIISEDDKNYFWKNGVDVRHVSVIPVAVRDDITAQKTNYKQISRDICFLGKMSYQPNEDAAIWFAQSVLPILRKDCPDIQFSIMGIEPSPKVKSLESWGNIKVTGFLDDPYAYISTCLAMVVPIRNGAGMQNKVLESMYVGTPTVISPIAAEGIAGQNGVHYLQANTPEEYAHSILQLLKSPQLCQLIGEKARKLVNDKYTWGVLSAQWEKLIST